MKNVPIFYACDDAFIKYAIVSLTSMIENADKNRSYDVHFLYSSISEEMKESVLALANEQFHIEFNDVSGYLLKIADMLPIRDYYSKTTYFRIFISEMFPTLDKVIYIDADTIILGDISKLYDYKLGNHLVGACNEQAMVQEDVFGTYVETVLGIDRDQFFNAGLLLINAKAFRTEHVLNQFIELLNQYVFVVTQDEDYLNLICKNRVLWIDNGWNTEVFGEIKQAEADIKMIHYIMVSKPWHYDNCRLQNHFWKYASKTKYYKAILDTLKNYTDASKQKDLESAHRLVKLAIDETNREDNYLRQFVLCKA